MKKMAESVSAISVATTVEATFDVENYYEDQPFKTTYLNTMLQCEYETIVLYCMSRSHGFPTRFMLLAGREAILYV